MSWQDPLTPLGLDSKVVVAGFMGGLVRAFIRPHPHGLLPTIGIMIVGAITAAYVTPIVAHMFALDLNGDPGAFTLAAAYLIGHSGETTIRWGLDRWRGILHAAVDEEEEPRRKRRQNDDFPEAG